MTPASSSSSTSDDGSPPPASGPFIFRPRPVIMKYKAPYEARFHISNVPKPPPGASEEVKRAYIESYYPPEFKNDPEGLENYIVEFTVYLAKRRKAKDDARAALARVMKKVNKAYPVSLTFSECVLGRGARYWFLGGSAEADSLFPRWQYYAKHPHAAEAMKPGLDMWNEARLSYDEAVQNGTSATWVSPFAHLSKLYVDPALLPPPESSSNPPTPSIETAPAPSSSAPTPTPAARSSKADSVKREKHAVKTTRNKNSLHLDLGKGNSGPIVQKLSTSPKKGPTSSTTKPPSTPTKEQAPVPHNSPASEDNSSPSPKWRIRSLTADSSSDGSVMGYEAGSEGSGSGRSDAVRHFYFWSWFIIERTC